MSKLDVSCTESFEQLPQCDWSREFLGYPTRPLYEAVIGNALNAAFGDRRFQPLQRDELPRIELEISALTPPHEVPSYEAIVIGKHGVLLSKDGRRAVFLPQVAPNQRWDRPKTLEQLSLKAGLPADAWKEQARFKVFEAIVFAEGHV